MGAGHCINSYGNSMVTKQEILDVMEPGRVYLVTDIMDIFGLEHVRRNMHNVSKHLKDLYDKWGLKRMKVYVIRQCPGKEPELAWRWGYWHE